MKKKEVKDKYSNIILFYFFIFKPYTYIISYLTKFFPFSLLPKNKLCHAYWIGIFRITNLIRFVCSIHRNEFIEISFDRDEQNYYLFGKFKRKPNPKLFDNINRQIKIDGFELRYCGEFDDGEHKFIAPVKQNWMKWVWY